MFYDIVDHEGLFPNDDQHKSDFSAYYTKLVCESWAPPVLLSQLLCLLLHISSFPCLSPC